jgi:choline dehydrogenase
MVMGHGLFVRLFYSSCFARHLSNVNVPSSSATPSSPHASPHTALGDFDYIIVGAGSAGCVLANRLSADPSRRVLLLEAGGADDWHWIHIPVGYLFCIGNRRTDWCYKTEAEPGLNGRSILYARGRTLGGCSSINAMIYMRGQPRDYDEWATLTGDTRWNWQNVLPVFRDFEDHFAGNSEWHGAGGEWRVEAQRLHWEVLDIWQHAAAEQGIEPIADFNAAETNAGSARFQVNQRMGSRWNAAKAYLRPVMQRPNLTVLTHAHASAIDFSLQDGRRRATGVRFERDGAMMCASARCEVILAGGAINSPQLLQLSGVGDPELLRAHGIAVQHRLDGVGANLQDHLQLRLAYKVSGVRTLNEWYHTWWGKLQMAMQYAFRREGPLSMAPSQLGAFAKSDLHQRTPNLQYHVQPLSLDRFGEPLHRWPAVTMSVCNLRPTSRGHVCIATPSPTDAPRITLNYLSTETDRKVAVDAIRLTRRIANSAAFSAHTPQEFMPGAQFQSEAELVTAAGNIGTTIFHPVGTCKMGHPQDASAVVDSELRVIGIDGLRVVDASVMPTITSGNTNTPTMMIAERGAALITAAHASR